MDGSIVALVSIRTWFHFPEGTWIRVRNLARPFEVRRGFDAVAIHNWPRIHRRFIADSSSLVLITPDNVSVRWPG